MENVLYFLNKLHAYSTGILDTWDILKMNTNFTDEYLLTCENNKPQERNAKKLDKYAVT